jgi:hypothetical protein
MFPVYFVTHVPGCTRVLSQMNSIIDHLYGEQPTNLLYHYTSLDAIPNIIRDGALWATDIHYFNDSAELGHTAALLLNEIRTRQSARSGDQIILGQLSQWVADRVVNGHAMFVASLTANGNLLSQWRSYCTYGKGVSLGISAARLLECAAAQAFRVVKCVYDHGEQRRIAGAVVDAIEALALCRGPAPSSKAHPSQSYHPAFAECEDGVLRIAAVLKNPAFKEEAEWRAVSPIVADYVHTDISYRPGRSTLIPYKLFKLGRLGAGLELARVFVGPTPNVNLSMNSIAQFLSRNGLNPEIVNSQVPYRET